MIVCHNCNFWTQSTDWALMTWHYDVRVSLDCMPQTRAAATCFHLLFRWGTVHGHLRFYNKLFQFPVRLSLNDKHYLLYSVVHFFSLFLRSPFSLQCTVSSHLLCCFQQGLGLWWERGWSCGALLRSNTTAACSLFMFESWYGELLQTGDSFNQEKCRWN